MATEFNAQLAALARTGLSLDQQIALLEHSADFWQTSGASVRGTEPKTNAAMSAYCRVWALLLMLQRMSREGRPGDMQKIISEAEKLHSQLSQGAGQQQQGGGGMPGMGGGGMPGMGGGGMPGMGGGGMPGMGGGGMPGMGGGGMPGMGGGGGRPGGGMGPGMGGGGMPGMGGGGMGPGMGGGMPGMGGGMGPR